MRLARILLVLAAVGRLGTPPAAAQEEPPIDPGALINFPFTEEADIGGFDAGQQRVRSLKIPFSRWLRSPDEQPWGLRLRIPVTLGVYSLRLSDLIEDFDLDRVQAIAVVPALEFLVPVGERWTLKPRQDLGLGKDLAGGDLVLIAATGVQALHTRAWKTLLTTSGAKFKYSLSRSSGGDHDDEFGLLELGFDSLANSR